MAIQKRQFLELYRNILRLHRKKLPQELRSLGDAYLKDEFKRHQTATGETIQQFTKEWEKYYKMMKERKIQYGVHLTNEQKDALNDEQKLQLEALKKKTLE